eukprot:XP_001696198.1 threonine-tRNA ligase [Chlamydomonas reinhardtii]
MAAASVGPSPVEERMPYYKKRVEVFEKFLEREQAKLEAAKAANVAIKVIMPDGKERAAVQGVTTPMDIAKEISASLAKKVVVADVDGHAWDLARPLEGDCALKLFSFDDTEGKDAFWHSSAHLLGQALELEFGVDLTIGPALEEGFYYDCFMGDRTLTEADKARLEKRIEGSVKESQKFQRVVVTREEALSMFEENKFKIEIIQGLPADATITIYRVGPMVDLCSGPHLPSTSYMKAISVTQMSRAFWRGDVKREPLQRVYGVTFPDSKLLKDYQHRMEEAKKRDHRVVGVQQELFFFHPLSPGSCFFLPHGARIYNNLVGYIREKYWEYEYEEVITPNIYNFDLWKTSGHADHYRENMFSFDIEKQEFGLKPMNCPARALHAPDRLGTLSPHTTTLLYPHRPPPPPPPVPGYAFTSLVIMSVMAEVQGFLKLLGEVYEVFGLDCTMALSTRPEGYLGDIELWNKAEQALTDALNSTGKAWVLNPGDGAFYGPKIDITVYDALRRKFQCATVQLDFQLPIRFGLEYASEAGTLERPVIVHRAVLGSVERMFAILTEHFAGKWPFWLNPRQVMVVPISENSVEYAFTVRKELRSAGLHCDVDSTDRKMQKKVREAQLAQYNYILVVGEAEKTAQTVNVRTRDNVVHGMFKLSDVRELMVLERNTRSRDSALSGKGQKPAEGDGAAEADA